MVKRTRKMRKRQFRGRHLNKKTRARHSKRRTRRSKTTGGNISFLRNMFKKKKYRSPPNSPPLELDNEGYVISKDKKYRSPRDSPPLELDKEGYVIGKNRKRLFWQFK